jgi:hypothetical protein
VKIESNETVKRALLALMGELYAGEAKVGKRRHILAALQRSMGNRVKVSDRTMRKAAQALREEDFPICMSERGYYLGTNRAEIEKAAAHLRRIAAGRFGGDELPLWRASPHNPATGQEATR